MSTWNFHVKKLVWLLVKLGVRYFFKELSSKQDLC